MMQVRVVQYVRNNGRVPVQDWLNQIKDKRIYARILERVRRISKGQLGDVKFCGDEIFEARLHFGPGYRIYFARDRAKIILLLCGGDKGTQKRDIRLAKEYWQEYLRRKI